MMDTKNNKLWRLFWSTFQISAYTFGGGFVIIALMRKKFVDKMHWIEEQEMLDLTAIAQSSPGAIAVNAAILVGWRVAGFIGMVTAVLGTIIPPIAIISIISLFYKAFAANRYVALMLTGMRAGVAAVILDVAVGMGTGVVKSKSVLRIVMLCAAFVAAFILDVNAVVIILVALVVGIISALIGMRKEAGK